MSGSKVARRRAHFAREHLAWIVVRHFLSAGLVEELSRAVIGVASRRQLAFDDLFDTARSGGPSALASWAVRPRPIDSAFGKFLQRFILQLVRQNDQTAGSFEREATPEEAAVMRALDGAVRCGAIDIGTIALATRLAEPVPESLEAVLSMISRLSALPSTVERGNLRPLLTDCLRRFEAPLDAVIVKHLGDLCADVDRWKEADELYEWASELLTVADPAWLGFTTTLGYMVLQSRAAALRTLEGPGAASSSLARLIEERSVKMDPLPFVNATPDELNAKAAEKEMFFGLDTRTVVLLAPQLLETDSLELAYDHWLNEDFADAHRWFWAVLRRQIAFGSASYSRHTKASYGRSVVDAARSAVGKHKDTRQFELAIRLLVESGEAKAVEATLWAEPLVAEYVDAECIAAAVAHARRAAGAEGERTLVVVALFKHWLTALPRGTESLAKSMLLFLVLIARDGVRSLVSKRSLAGAAFETLIDVAKRRPEFRRLAADAVADAIVTRLGEASMLAAPAALELAYEFLDAFDESALARIVMAILGGLGTFGSGQGPWTVLRPAIAILSSERVLSLCKHDSRLSTQVPKALIELGLESESEHASLMYLLRDLDPVWVQGQVDLSRVDGVVQKLRQRAGQTNSSRAGDDILALLVAPAFSGADGLRDAMKALLSILDSAVRGRPSISFERAYNSLMLIGEKRAALASEAALPVEEFDAFLSRLFEALLDVWKRAVTTPLIFAGFAIPTPTAPNHTLVHNWTFASVGFARSLGREQEMGAALASAARVPSLETSIAVARAIRITAGDPETFDVEVIREEKREAFYAALGQRLALLRGLPEQIRLRVTALLLEQCLRLGPKGLDAGVFAIASQIGTHVEVHALEAEAYRRRLDNDPDLRLGLAPLFESLRWTGRAVPQ